MIKRVEAGEEIVVTVSGRPVAKIVPLTVGGLRVAKPATKKIDWTTFPRIKTSISSEEILADLRDDR